MHDNGVGQLLPHTLLQVPCHLFEAVLMLLNLQEAQSPSQENGSP